MCVKNAIQLSLDGDTFSILKKDFDAVLLRTVGNMESKCADEATVTLKLSISLEKQSTNFGDEPKQITRPTFKHDISSVMQVKDKVSGTLKEDYELVFDDDEGKYVMRRISNGQMTLFDTVEDEEDGEDVEYMPAQPPALEAGKTGNLGDENADGDRDGYWVLSSSDAGENAVSSTGSIEVDASKRNSPFEWLKQFVGLTMSVTENMGNYAVRTDDNKIVLTSSTSPESVFYCSADKLSRHVGHRLSCVGYGVDELLNISIECEDCEETVFEMDAYKSEDAVADAPEEVDDADDLDEFEGYEYEEPDEA